MPYRDVVLHDFRARPSPIYTPLLPSTPPTIETAVSPQPKQKTGLQKLETSLRRIVDPGGAKEPLSLRLALQKGAFWAEVGLPVVLPGAPLSFTVKLSESQDPLGHELLLVGARLRNGWSDYFATLEKERYRYRIEALLQDEYAQQLLSNGQAVSCPRCGESSYRRAKREALRLRDLPVPLLRTKESCHTCNLARLIEEIRCAKCQGILAPIDRIRHGPDSSDPELPTRDVLRWRCESCQSVLVSTSTRYTEPQE